MLSYEKCNDLMKNILIIQKCSTVFIIEKIKLKKIFLNDYKTFLCLEIVMSYKGNSRKCIEYVITYNSKFFENFPNLIENIISIYDK